MGKRSRGITGFAIAVVMILSVIAVGCGTKTPKETGAVSAAPEASAKKTEMMMGTATTGGFTYIWGGAAAAVLNKYIPTVNFTAQITTGGSENIMRIISGEMPIGIAGSNVVQKFYDGEKSENIKANKNLRTIWTSKSTVFSVIVHKDSPYKTLEDLKGKKVSIGNKGGSAYESIITFLNALGMGGDYFNLQYLTMNESLDAMKTQTIDAFATNTSDPHSAMTEVFMMPGGARFLDLPKDKIDILLKKVPYLSPAVRPAGTYKGQETDCASVGSPYVLVATDKLPDDIAYEIAKVLDEKYDEWVGIAKNVEGSTLEGTVKSAYAPLHPGVAKYAREKGLLK
jgi:TRAP transporter TAXI family solute receptor